MDVSSLEDISPSAHRFRVHLEHLYGLDTPVAKGFPRSKDIKVTSDPKVWNILF